MKNYRVHYQINYTKRSIPGSFLAFDKKNEEDAKEECKNAVSYTHNIKPGMVEILSVEVVVL